ncbi:MULTISPECIES: bis(5'-nucleosyl)-tetraphosphatase (symmetrical) YqeK [unclassified Adlercreutzia]|uniref:bis(5'-nucleosyl)-tetraphosphatase (symmetrical) YqeK n=1 Tax=unclassified Adlercreutzia TaxID=2636013 RepID=UPI0013ED7774|nr:MULTISPECIES: bis(5'-nucleosyl)-tetraphosphatase (symmetrical) YqeK [unclassified Adlercreutzia]
MEDVFSQKFLDARIEDLKGRVKPKRFKHIMGVADTAELLAKTYGEDRNKARLAGLLHDWDKGYRDKEIRQRAYDLGVDALVGEWMIENMPEVLHGPTAAAALEREFPQIPSDVLKAIRWHTTASLDMSNLDKIVYIADALEPSRSFQEAELLRSYIGQISLDELYYRVYKFWTLALIASDRVLHPDTISIWNSIAAEKSKAKKEKYA